MTGPLAGITLTLNTADSARNQRHPDVVKVRNPNAAAALTWADGAVGGVMAGTCRPYRAAWLGFGLEGAGPQAARIESMKRLVDWLVAPVQAYGLRVTAAAAPQIGLPGAIVTHTLDVRSSGVLSDTIDLHVEEGDWPLTLALPDGRVVSSDASFPLAGCGTAAVVARVAIPAAARVDARATYTLTFRSRNDPAITERASITAKTPAPLLFVADEELYVQGARFTHTFDALGLSYDSITTQGNGSVVITDTLLAYPMAIWTTGYDWLAPLMSSDETRLAAFLDHGGRLLLTGQDILDVAGIDSFMQDRLGVAGASLSITTTEILSLPDSPLGADLGPWRLLYPYRDWSDVVTVAPGAVGLLQNQRGFTSAVGRRAADWRTAFFPFPLEALSDDARETLIGRTILWLSPFGESHFETPAVAAAGSRVPITLTLSLAAATPRVGSSARLPLPAGVSLAADSLQGGWHLDAAENVLVWAGALLPDEVLALRADLLLPASIPDGKMALRAELDDGGGWRVPIIVETAIDAPWLALSEQVGPSLAAPGDTLHYTLTVRNDGLMATTARRDGHPALRDRIDGGERVGFTRNGHDGEDADRLGRPPGAGRDCGDRLHREHPAGQARHAADRLERGRG